MSLLLRSALLGLATGSRSTAGLAALAVAAPPGRSPSWLRAAATLAAAGELVGDKLPQAPSRLQRPGLLARLVAGGASGVVLARRSGASAQGILSSGALAAAAAWAGAQAGSRWRARAGSRAGADLPGALAEDLGCLALARYATR
jgi:uncharacterized membrane protein